MPLTLKFTSTPLKYLNALDRTTRDRILEKLAEVAKDPLDARLSKPLEASTKRGSRVGDYRILFEYDDKDLIVSDIGPRGQIYRKA